MIKSVTGGIVDYFQHLRMISKNAWMFLAGSFFINLLFAINFLIFNLYLRELGFSESVIGRTLSAGAIGSLVAAIPCALIIARYPIKRMLIATTMILAVCFFMMVTVREPLLIMFFSFLVGANVSFSRVASAPIIMRNSTPEERTYVFSLSFANWMLPGMIGSVLGGYAQEWYAATFSPGADSYRFVLLAGIVLGICAIGPFALIKAKPPSSDERKLVLNKALLKDQGRILSKLALPFFFVGMGAGLIIPFLNLYFRDEFSMSTDEIGIYYSLVQATMIIGTMAGPVLAKKIGMVRTIVWTELASIPFMLLMAFSGYEWIVVASFLCRGALMNMGQPIGTNFAMEMVRKEVHGLTNSVMMIAWTSSWAVSTQIGGWVIEHHGYIPSFLITVGLYTLSAFLYFTFFSRSEKKENGVYHIQMGSKRDFS